MNKTICIAFFCLIINTLFSQTVVKDTIYITNNNMSHLIFTDEPAHTDFGSGYITSDSNGVPAVKKVGDNWIVILKARKKFKRQTNISVITTTNIFYDIACIYAENIINNYNTFDYGNKIKLAYQKEKKGAKLARINPDDLDEEVDSAKKKDSIIDLERSIYYEDSVKYKGQAKLLYSSSSKNVKRVYGRNGDIRLSLVGSYARKDKIYLKINIYNGGSLPFDIDKWDFFYANTKGFNLETSSRRPVKLVHEYNSKYQSVIPQKNQTKVFVFDEFAITNKQKFYVMLSEKNGERDILMSFESHFINRAQVISDSYK